jgi:hypothetical protein
MYPMEYKNLHAPKGRVPGEEEIGQCTHRFFWALPDDIGWVEPSAMCDWYSDDHLGEIFHQVLALQEDWTLHSAADLTQVKTKLLWSVSIRPKPQTLHSVHPMSAALVPLASLSQIDRTPSREDGLPADLEEDLKAFGCKLVHQAGILLKQFVFSHPFPAHYANM